MAWIYPLAGANPGWHIPASQPLHAEAAAAAGGLCVRVADHELGTGRSSRCSPPRRPSGTAGSAGRPGSPAGLPQVILGTVLVELEPVLEARTAAALDVHTQGPGRGCPLPGSFDLGGRRLGEVQRALQRLVGRGAGVAPGRRLACSWWQHGGAGDGFQAIASANLRRAAVSPLPLLASSPSGAGAIGALAWIRRPFSWAHLHHLVMDVAIDPCAGVSSTFSVACTSPSRRPLMTTTWARISPSITPCSATVRSRRAFGVTVDATFHASHHNSTHRGSPPGCRSGHPPPAGLHGWIAASEHLPTPLLAGAPACFRIPGWYPVPLPNVTRTRCGVKSTGGITLPVSWKYRNE